MILFSNIVSTRLICEENNVNQHFKRFCVFSAFFKSAFGDGVVKYFIRMVFVFDGFNLAHRLTEETFNDIIFLPSMTVWKHNINSILK